MKKLNKVVVFFCFILTVFSCSSDDENNSQEQEQQSTNVITLNNETYVVNSVFVEPSIGGSTFVSLINKSKTEVLDALNNGTQLDNVNIFTIRINQNPLAEQTYNFSDMPSLQFEVNAQFIDGELEDGNILLDRNNSDDNLNANSGSITISSLTTDTINFSFEFTRNDGEIVNGNFNGNFLMYD